jgi:hypothetical protein
MMAFPEDKYKFKDKDKFMDKLAKFIRLGIESKNF